MVTIMGADKHEKERRRERLPPFVPLLIDTLDTPAWKAMSHGARSLYVALKRQYNVQSHNNGRMFLSQRKAAHDVGSHHNEIARWFRELQHYGFIVKTAPGYLGGDRKGKAPRWRLTELGYMHNPPTRDFRRWNGTAFKDQKTKSRAGNGARRVQATRHTSVPGNRPANGDSVRETAHISQQTSVRANQHRTILPSPSAQLGGAQQNQLSTTTTRRGRVRPRLRDS
jgi:hypothetical protein